MKSKTILMGKESDLMQANHPFLYLVFYIQCVISHLVMLQL